jgi:hypothetical protein
MNIFLVLRTRAQPTRLRTRYLNRLNHGITGMTNRSRSDKGQARKVTPEELLEAINAARPHFHTKRTNKRAIYRFCIEKGLLHADRIAQTTATQATASRATKGERRGWREKHSQEFCGPQRGTTRWRR